MESEGEEEKEKKRRRPLGLLELIKCHQSFVEALVLCP